ncbi:hypothetical protein [Mycobacterium sp.]|uniref:hypothetical protein n=1 Tax=Mycobacterium sp. TaxID=1785 RepID=UPI003C75C215
MAPPHVVLNDCVLDVFTYVAEQFDSKLQLQAVYLVWTRSDIFGQAFEQVLLCT